MRFFLVSPKKAEDPAFGPKAAVSSSTIDEATSGSESGDKVEFDKGFAGSIDVEDIFENRKQETK